MAFADTPVTLPDGQNTRTKCPQEIWARGFIPPVRLPDGRVRKGDVFVAGWFNDIINQIDTLNNKLPVLITDPNAMPITPGPTTNPGGNYVVGMHVGPISLEIGLWYNTDGNISLKTGTTFKTGTMPHLYLIDLSDPTVTAGKMSLWSAAKAAPTPTPVAFKPLTRAENATSPGAFLYIAVGENNNPLTPGDVFCRAQTTFEDGQSSFTPPTQEQINFGFAPAQMVNSVVVPGDTLPANVLNYLLHDLTANSGAIRWEIGVDPNNAQYARYRLIIGDMQIESFRTAVPAAPADNGVVIPWPFGWKTGYNPESVGTLCGIANTGVTSIALARSVAGGVNVSNRSIAANNAAPGVTGTLDVLGFGPAPENLTAKRLVPALTGFATQDKTYPDGQKNKVTPVAAALAAGFRPNQKNAAGLPVVGDLVMANELNWIFEALYRKQAPAKVQSGIIAPDAATFVRGGGWLDWGNVRMYWVIKSGMNAAQSDASGMHTHNFIKPFKDGTRPFVYASGLFQHETAVQVYSTNDTNRLTNTYVHLGAFGVAQGAKGPFVGEFQLIAFGVKP